MKVHLDHLALILVHQLRMEAHLMFSLQKVHQDKANQNLQQRSLIHHQLLHQHLLLNHQNQRRLRSQLNHQQIKKHPRKKRLILINQMILKKVIMQNQLLHLLTQQQNQSQSHQSLKKLLHNLHLNKLRQLLPQLQLQQLNQPRLNQ